MLDFRGCFDSDDHLLSVGRYVQVAVSVEYRTKEHQNQLTAKEKTAELLQVGAISVMSPFYAFDF